MTTRLVRRLLFVAAATAALLACLELYLRATGFSAPIWYRPDPELGWTLREGVRGWYTEEGRALVEVNSAGQRDREHALAKPDNVYRIAVLGDAYAEAMQVPLDKTYWAQLPERLHACGFQRGKSIEVLNFGVRDYGTAQAYLMLERRALRYRPDLLVLQFDNGNDVRDNSYALDTIKDRPFFRPDAQGGLRLDTSFVSRPSYVARASRTREIYRNVLDRSRALQFARGGLQDLRLTATAHAKSETGNEAGLEAHTLAPPRDALWEEAWQVSEALIKKVGELGSRHGATVAVVAVPFALEVHPDAALRARLQAKYGVADFAYPDRRAVAFAGEQGMLGILLAPEMKALATASGRHLYGFDNFKLGFGHWNEHGHIAAAEIISRALCASRS